MRTATTHGEHMFDDADDDDDDDNREPHEHPKMKENQQMRVRNG